MNSTQTFKLLGLAGICVGVTVVSGCQTRYSGGDASFAGNEAAVFAPEETTVELTEAAQAETTVVTPAKHRGGESDAFLTGENPMPAALAPVQPGAVKYPDPKPAKAPEYWQQHSNPYAGITAPAGTASAAGGKTASGQTVYVVQHGDTLGHIAKKQGVSLKSIKAINGGINYDKLLVGQKIYIPAKGTAAAKAGSSAPASSGSGIHVVQKGDILGRIARQYGVKIADLKAANGLTSDTIKVGQKLKIPGKTAAKAPAAAKVDHKETKAPAAEAKAATSADSASPAVAAPEIAAPALPAVAAPVIKAEAPVAAAEEKPEAKAPAANAANMTKYVVKENEDIFSIAVKWSLTSGEIKAANPGIAEAPAPGTIINLPISSTAK